MPGTPSTGNATNTFAIDNTQPYSVIAQTWCCRIIVQENVDTASLPTADLIQCIPPGAQGVKIPMGSPAVFTPQIGAAWFIPNQVVGTVQTRSGSITVQQIEGQRV